MEREIFRLTDNKLDRFMEKFYGKLDGYLAKLDTQGDKIELLDKHIHARLKEMADALRTAQQQQKRPSEQRDTEPVAESLGTSDAATEEVEEEEGEQEDVGDSTPQEGIASTSGYR